MTHDGLHRLARTQRFQRVWLKPGAGLEGYDKLLPINAGIRFKRPPRASRGEFPLSETQLERLRGGMREAFEAELTRDGAWQIVSERGPDVLVVRGALIDLVVTARPDPVATRERSYSTSVGEATLVVEIFDSESLEILARIADRRVVEKDSMSWRNDTIRNRAAARRLFRTWARWLRQGLEIARTSPWPEPAGEGDGV